MVIGSKLSRNLKVLAVVVLSLGMARALWSATSRADELFQQALVKESGERDLEGAIELYQKVLDQPGAERVVLFEARMRMGACYERLGKLDAAEQAYEQILKEAAGPQS